MAQHKDRVYSFAYYYLGDRDQAEDVTQDVLIKLWRHWDDLEVDDLAAWLTTVTRNASFDALRRRKRAAPAPGGDEAFARMPDPRPGPAQEAAGHEMAQRLHAALQELPEPYRSILVLREIQQRPHQEIADSLEMPLVTVRVYAHRGRKLLRESLSRALGEAAETPGPSPRLRHR
ncbi:MAG TPA: sigma-70 family RNA polymerase sigma factor [Thermoanaerobaculia bacterium]|nr:sigma-70 family RNA polymerase sigma factor [Thermoanaerobaculia bacterium]